MIEIGTGEAKSATLACEHDPGIRSEIFPTFVTSRISVGNEDLEFLTFIHNILDRFGIVAVSRQKV